MRHSPFILALTAATAISSSAIAQPRCGLTEELQAGETLTELAERCGTEPAEILRVNDAETAAELPEGRLRMPIVEGEEVEDFVGRARDAVRDAGSRIEDAATAAGQSVSDYLAERPDLNRDLAEFGERIGLPGVTTPPAGGPDVNVQNADGEAVMVEAAGLPGEREVNIYMRRNDELELLRSAQTEPAGTLSAEVEIPPGAGSDGEVLIVVETNDGRVRLVSDPVAYR